MLTAVTGAGQLDLWLRSFDTANWDLAVINCGPDEFKCPQCIHVERGQGTKWQAVFQFLHSSAFKRGYGLHYEQVRSQAALYCLQAALLGLAVVAWWGVTRAMPLEQHCTGSKRSALTERCPKWPPICGCTLLSLDGRCQQRQKEPWCCSW